MDIGFNQSWTKDPAAQAASEGAGQLDWHGLRARLTATHAARHALGVDCAPVATATAGSFDRDCARVLSDYATSLAAINPVFWGNRKPTRTMGSPVAGELVLGERG